MESITKEDLVEIVEGATESLVDTLEVNLDVTSMIILTPIEEDEMTKVEQQLAELLFKIVERVKNEENI